MLNNERKLDMEKQTEYSFDKGVNEACKTIERLVANQDYVVVAVIGSASDVGKTKLSSAIMKNIFTMGISCTWCSDINSLRIKPHFPDVGSTKGRVLMLNAEYPPINRKEVQDAILARQAKQFGLSISKIDLRVCIYRPDKPFVPYELRFADIIIRNEHAVDKQR